MGDGSTLKERMKVLRDNGVIVPEVAAFMEKVIDRMEEELPDIPKGHAERFTTHMAMAVERVRKGEIAEPLDAEEWEQVTACEEYVQGERFYENMMAFSPVAFPESERQYLLLHICTMLAETGE